MIKSLAHVCIYSTDLQKTLDFYVGQLGLKKKFDFIKEGELFGFYLEVDSMHFVEVFKTKNEALPQNARITHFCLETDDMDALRSKLLAAGYPAGDKHRGADNSYQFWVRGLDGVDIEFHEYTQDSSQYTGADCVVNW